MDFKGSENRDTIEDVAKHEASHAFAIWWFGGILEKISITGPLKKSEKCPTLYFCEFGPNQNFSGLQEAVELRAQVALAPSALEAQAGIEVPTDASLHDIFEFLQLLAWEGQKVQKMAGDAMRLLKNAKTDWKAASLEFFEKHGAEVGKIIAQPLARKAIGELAKNLLDQGSLSGHQAIGIFEKVWGGGPEQALPKRFHSKNFTVDSLPAVLKSLGQMLKMDLNMLRSYREQNVAEEKIIDEISGKLLEIIFQIDSVFSKL